MPLLRLPTTDYLLPTKNGFTLIEILVSMSILAIVTAVGIPTLRNFSETQLLNNELDKLASTLRQAQSYAQANVQPAPTPLSTQLTAPCANNLILNWEVLIYADNYSIGTICQDPASVPTQMTTANIKTTTNLVSNLALQAPSGCPLPWFVTFTRKSTYFSCGSSNTISFTLTDTQLPGIIKTITINQGGSINAK